MGLECGWWLLRVDGGNLYVEEVKGGFLEEEIVKLGFERNFVFSGFII